MNCQICYKFIINNALTKITVASGTSLVILAMATPSQAFTVTFFSPTVFSNNLDILNQNVGVTGYAIENFEDLILIPGLSISYSGGVPTTTITSLPNLSNTLAESWDGQHTLFNIRNNRFNGGSFCPTTECAKLTTFQFTDNVVSVGIGLSGFQSLNPPPSSPDVPITNHRLLINGIPLATTIEQLAGTNWIPASFRRNAYLRIDAGQEEFIASIGFENITALPSSEDVLEFDHLAIQVIPEPPQAIKVPEPSSILGLLGVSLLGFGAFCKRKLNQK